MAVTVYDVKIHIHYPHAIDCISCKVDKLSYSEDGFLTLRCPLAYQKSRSFYGHKATLNALMGDRPLPPYQSGNIEVYPDYLPNVAKHRKSFVMWDAATKPLRDVLCGSMRCWMVRKFRVPVKLLRVIPNFVVQGPMTAGDAKACAAALTFATSVLGGLIVFLYNWLPKVYEFIFQLIVTGKAVP